MVEYFHGFFTLFREEMSIGLKYLFYSGVTETVSNFQCIDSVVDEQACMAVAEIMNANSLAC